MGFETKKDSVLTACWQSCRRGIIVLIWWSLLAASGLSTAEQTEQDHTNRQGNLEMKIELSENHFFLGEPIPVGILFENRSSNDIFVADPAASFDVEMHVVDKTTGEDMSYTMGQAEATIIEGGHDQWALSVPVPENITIAAKAAHHFTSDLNERLFLREGDFEVYVTDTETESEHIDISIVLEDSSLPLLAATAINPDLGYGRREWAMDWVQLRYPDFILKLPDPNTPDLTAKKYEAYNQSRYQDFLIWHNTDKK